jgi:prophage antirepressor-like protein
MDDRSVKLFENRRVRTAWDEEKEEWYFSIIDICVVLTDSNYQTARNYWKWLKNKLSDEGSELVSNANQLKMLAPDGKMRLTDVADTKQVFA